MYCVDVPCAFVISLQTQFKKKKKTTFSATVFMTKEQVFKSYIFNFQLYTLLGQPIFALCFI